PSRSFVATPAGCYPSPRMPRLRRAASLLLTTSLSVGLGWAWSPASSAAPPSGRVRLDRVVAVVGDQIILDSELWRQTQRHPLLQEAMSQLPANASAELVEQKRRDVEAKVLDELIDLELLRA